MHLMLKTFSIQTLGCRVNQYEGEQLAALLRDRGLTAVDPGQADLRIINSCSVTLAAAGKSRQLTRRAAGRETARNPKTLSLPQLRAEPPPAGTVRIAPAGDCGGGETVLPTEAPGIPESPSGAPSRAARCPRPRVVVTGCWATSDREAAAALPGVDAVVGHHQDVAAEFARLLTLWQDGEEEAAPRPAPAAGHNQDTRDHDRSNRAATPTHAGAAELALRETVPELSGGNGWISRDTQAGSPAGNLTDVNKPPAPNDVNAKFVALAAFPRPPTTLVPNPTSEHGDPPSGRARPAGTTALPLLDGRQTGRQRAYLKIQDGCDAHCTYCIIPRLRPTLWSKPVEDAVEEARRLVAAGHVELVLTGIFLGAYGQPTALRRRQPHETAGPLARLIDALCTRVPGLRRLRLSSLEPGDLTPDLLSALRSHEQLVPHFHLPLQSGSDALLRRMNRQYTRGEFLRLVGRVRSAFDRPALTTDVIVGFPGETDGEFARTLEVVDEAGFIHVHAFSYSPRPGTAAARWTGQFVRGPVVDERVEVLRSRAAAHGLAFRRQFVGEVVELLVEHEKEDEGNADTSREAMPPGLRHGRCERYFPVYFEDAAAKPGEFVRVRVERVSPNRTFGKKEAVLSAED